MPIDSSLIDMLMCPVSKTSVQLADSILIQKINALIRGEHLKYRNGDKVTEPIEAGLVSKGQPPWFYIIKDGIPVMLPDEAIPL